MGEVKNWSRLRPVHAGRDGFDGVRHGDKLLQTGAKASVEDQAFGINSVLLSPTSPGYSLREQKEKSDIYFCL